MLCFMTVMMETVSEDHMVNSFSWHFSCLPFREKFTEDPSSVDLEECGQNHESLHHFLLSLLLKGGHINLLLIM